MSRQYAVIEAQNLSIGQAGSILVTGTTAVTCGAGTGTIIDANGGAAIDGETFPQGMTIFGRWTGFTLASGACIAYVG